MSFVWS